MALDLYVNSRNSLIGLETALRIAMSNANNFNTPGYKYVFASFSTMYAEAISSGTETTNPKHVGASMSIGATSTDYSQGNISIGSNLDVALSGEGFLMVSASAIAYQESDPKLYTRSGRFVLDSENKYITDTYGRKVYGFKVDSEGNPINSELVPIETDGHLDVGFTDGGIFVANFNKNKQGSGEAKPLYRLAVTSFQNKQGLVLTSGGAYRPTAATGDRFVPGIAQGKIGDTNNTFADILPESLETSNVDVARVALDMNILNRAYSAIQAVIDDNSKIMSSLISKIIS
jgi:flagellar hook protein FlgE